jgi:L-ribulokinase
MSFTLGIDFGTNSVRAVVVDRSEGQEIGSCVIDYPSGKRGVLLDSRDPNLARQHPGDHFIGLEKSVRGALQAAESVPGFSAEKVIGIGVDTTGSSPKRLIDLSQVMKELIRIREEQTASSS